MTPDELAALTVRDLSPLLAATATTGPRKVNRRKRGGRGAPGNRMWISVPGGIEVSLTRSLPLSTWEAGLLEPYGNALADLDGVPDAVSRNAAEDVSLRAIAVQLGGDYSPAVESAIRFLFRCAVSTYEGQPVHLNLLLDLERISGSAAILDFDALQTFGWHPLLGSGLETGLVVDRTGGIVELQDTRAQQPGQAPAIDSLGPDTFRFVGDWSARGNRVALSLSRSRELLVHQAGSLRYIHRSGSWRGLPLAVALRTAWSAGTSIRWPVKRAVLESVVDASLGHHGASLAVVAKGQKNAFGTSNIVQPSDAWPANIRSRLFASQTFQVLTRRERLEMLSMDGATVLDHTGQILTAGAIVGVPGGSTGGGRLAATRELAKFGAAFKVSQDGPISLFGRNATGGIALVMAFA